LDAEPVADDVTAEELEKYRVTLYTETEYFPLGGLVTTDGEPYDSGVLRGGYVLLNLGASWCPFCGKEKPGIENLHREKPIENLTILTIFLGEEAVTVKEYLEANNYSFPAAVDEQNSLREQYAPRLPTSYVLDATGKILARINGSKEWDGEEVQQILRHMITN
jgi:thiol-disulfide isomerase/thioredoxin